MQIFCDAMNVGARRGSEKALRLRIRELEAQRMFLDYYQLREQPFGPVSDPAYLYPSRTYCEALELFGESLLSERGNLALIAESGMGKTTLLYQVLVGLRESGRTTFLFQKHCSAHEILQFLLNELGIDSAGMGLEAMHAKLNENWFAEMLAGKRFVLLFDDAEELNDVVLKTLRQISRYETSNSKLLQIVLCGQPQLLETLGRADLAQLRKRIVEVKHLEALSVVETHGYVQKRMTAAGHRGKSRFEPEALALIAERGQGIPRDINKICSRALLEAYARGLYTVTEDIVEKAERNLAAMAAAGGPTDTHAEEIEGVSADLQWIGKEAKQFSLPGSGVWVATILGVLLSGGLALPHGMLRGMTQIMRGQQAVLASPEQREEAPQQPANPVRPVINALAQPAISTKRSLNADTAPSDVAEALPEARYDEGGQLSLTRELGLKINRIVIDPGHGGSDTGAKGPHGLLEKDLCLDVALRLGQMIEESIHGAEVVYTRKDDSYVPLEERTAIANGAGADLFISIHANSSDSREVRGVETYYLSLAASREAKELAIRENALTQSSLHDLPDLVQKITRNEKIAESRLLALEIQDTLAQRLQLVSRREKNRGVKQAPFIVLAGANMPAVLSEISFVSNANDESLLQESGQRQRIAEGLYRGIAAYLDGLHGPSESKQKLITENRGNALSGFERSSSEVTRNPL